MFFSTHPQVGVLHLVLTHSIVSSSGCFIDYSGGNNSRDGGTCKQYFVMNEITNPVSINEIYSTKCIHMFAGKKIRIYV